MAFLCVSLSTLRAYFSLFSVFVTWKSAIEKLKVDCMGFSYFSFSSRGLFLFPAISMKFTIPKCFFLSFQIILLIFCSLALSFNFPCAYYCLIFNFSGRASLCGSILDKYSNLYLSSADKHQLSQLHLYRLFVPFFSYFTPSSSSKSEVGSIKCYSHIITTALYNPLKIRSV